MQLRKPIMFVPHELIIQILLRLPVKSLIRFKSVCKLWFSLIAHDSHFANSHFQLNSETHNRRILLISTSTHESLSIDCEASLQNDSASVSLNLDSIFPEDFTCYEINGSCRGFILFRCYLSIFIWNPSTGGHRQIPFSPFGSNFDAEYSFGFGYDESTDDYLVVSTSQHYYFEDPHFEYFSLKANAWKQVEAPHFPFANRYNLLHEPRGGSLYKGAIHWLAHCYDLCNNAIVAFDLIERKLSYMPLPHPLQCGGLWEYGEFLSVYTTNYRNHTVEIWVMKEYKVTSSWTMALVLPVDLIVCPKVLFFPLCCTKSGDIIGVDEEDKMFKYDKNGQFLDLHSYPNYDLRCKVTMYIDSLLSLPSDGDNKQTREDDRNKKTEVVKYSGSLYFLDIYNELEHNS